MLAGLLGLLLSTFPAAALSIPPAPSRFLYDGAGLLPESERVQLEEQLLALDQGGGPQIGIAIFPSLEGESLEEFTIRLAEAWKPGQKGKDEGALIVLFLAEKKIRIEVGYGLEGKIPDGMAGRIIREVMGPEFRSGRFGPGLSAGVTAITNAAGGKPVAFPRTRTSSRQARKAGSLFCPLAILIFVAFSSFVSRLMGRGRNVGGNIPWWMWLLLSSRSSGWSGGSRSSGTHWSGGGGSWGGGGGSSFGGGSFGGGGASGGW